ncbi:ectoine/hydroxyectoine ABC transporter permease subunit EhuC [Candidatus Formimonas warabiya]|uniref:Ectoine/hydroxyectoine ABC transporter permease subunit EhuC n=1 Tax=Formimonas warabiya TaxID=1761012 RepID=A0A3G1KWY3_FORW1|nr:ectoine/hydroxyectoine ABC transporter permease subunit EhuC [Candidatus Formimonas warabiya]
MLKTKLEEEVVEISYLDIIPFLLNGLGVTIQLTVMAAILAFMVAFIVGLARLSKYRIMRIAAKIYVEFFRGTSLLVQLFWAYFVLPLFGLELTAMQAGVMIMGLNYGAYSSEIVRSAILAIPKGQTEAGVALNLSPRQIMFQIILPQAFLIMLPPFGNNLIELLKGTALVSLITLSDLMFQGVKMNMTTMRTTEVFTSILLIYFVLAYPLTLGVRWCEKKLSAGRA